ncbi:MAG: porin family protein [Phaeodactylibacter sp.]|uniref:porin family protein n=1 Tax=Phaeodactylibacter sp. TaxID=1940289 RepID=UPI0032EC1930
MKERKDGFQHLRKQLQDFEHEVPATGWKEMSAILDGDKPVPQPVVPGQKRRRFAGWFWLTGALLLIGGGIWLGAQQQWSGPLRPNSRMILSALPVPLLQGGPGTAPAPTAQAPEPVASAKPTATAAPTKPTTTPPPVPTAPRNTFLPPSVNRHSAIAVAPLPTDTTADQNKPLVQLPPLPLPDSATKTPERIFAVLDQLPPLPAVRPEQSAPTAAAAMPDIGPATFQRWHFGLKAGADYQTLQTNALLGGFAQRRISPKWVIEAGLQYKQRSANHGRGLGITPPETDTIYLPALASVTPLHRPLTRLHFFEAPLTARYQTGKRLHLLGGFHIAYVRSTDRPPNGLAFDESLMNSTAADLVQNRAGTAAEGAKPAFEQWDLGLIAGLDYRLAPHWSVELRLQQGLRDLTPNTYYQNDEFYSNSNLQLALKWYW